MKHRLFHRWMTCWAYAATLALVLVPTIGRLAGQASMPMDHGATAGALAHLAAAHAQPYGTDPGMVETRVHAMAHASAHTGDATDSPTTSESSHHDLDEDCAYCPLLLGTIALPVPVLLAALPLRSPLMPIPAIRSAVLERHPTGLGSRGPPLAG